MDRTAAVVIEVVDQSSGEGRNGVPPTRVAVAESRQVEGLAVETVGEQPGDIGEVLRGTAEAVYVDGRLGTGRGGRGVADVQHRAVDGDPAGRPRRRYVSLREFAVIGERGALHQDKSASR